MGCTIDTEMNKELVAERAVNSKLNHELRKDAKAGLNVQKLLFLGPGDSGKSTVFKQLVSLFGDGYQEQHRALYTRNIHENILVSIKTLVAQADKWEDTEIDGVHYSCGVAPELEASKQFALNLNGEVDTVTHDTVNHILNLWKDPGIQNVHTLQSHFQFPYQIEYFIGRLNEVAQDNYIPSFEDMLFMRRSTTGILESTIVINSVKMHVVDVGGQRSERRKWINCFQDVTAVVYVCAISAYDQVLFEDQTTNALLEAVNLFEEISGSRYFVNTPIIAFLNKSDIFRDKIKRTPFTKSVVLQKWHDKEPPYDYLEATKFFRTLFFERNTIKDRRIYTHITTATDSDNINRVFGDVRDIVARNAIKEGGLNFV